MIYSGVGRSLTEQFEGCRAVAYRDTGGVWTCGYGHTRNVGPSTTCTLAVADQWLADDTQTAAFTVNSVVTVPLTQGQFDALVDFAFNCGCTAFAHSTMLDLLNAGDYAGAAEQFERWDKCDGLTIAGLLRRRVAEEGEFNGQA
jgi:lysozyme